MQAPPEDSLVRLRCAAGNLLVAQSQVHGIAPALEADVGDEGIGGVDLGAIRWPLFVLDENLQPAPHRAFRFCVCLRDADGTSFALACDAFAVVAADELQLRPLPDCMRTQNTPFEASALIADEAALRLDLTALSRHLERLG